jgi:hypothetical protein
VGYLFRVFLFRLLHPNSANRTLSFFLLLLLLLQ